METNYLETDALAFAQKNVPRTVIPSEILPVTTNVLFHVEMELDKVRKSATEVVPVPLYLVVKLVRSASTVKYSIAETVSSMVSAKNAMEVALEHLLVVLRAPLLAK